MSDIKLYNGDCLEIMKSIPNKSIDMILCDLPYGTTACKWDSVIPFEPLWEQYERIIKQSGNIVLFGSQPFTSKLINSNVDWFSYELIWEKEQGVNFLSSNKMPLKIHENICIFKKPDNYGVECFCSLRKCFKKIYSLIGKNKKDIIKEIGQSADHCFRFDSNQWVLPTKKTYEYIMNYYNIIPEYSYEELKTMYNNEFYRVYNPQKTVGKPYTSGLGNSGEVTGKVKKIQTENLGTRMPVSILKFNREIGLHPTQKPVALLEYLIKTYTNENETVFR